jgi:hypothetical protein
MKLNLLYEDYWQPIADHPGQLGKLDKRAKKNDKSFLVHPEDRKRWLKWFSGSKKIKEDLDDKDEFTNVPTQEQLEQTIRQLQFLAGINPKAIKMVETMKMLYKQLFGQPYIPQ